MKRVGLLGFCVLVLFAVVVKAETMFENFNSDPTASGWVDLGSGQTVFDYNSGGWLDATIVRDSANRALYYKQLSSAFNQSQEFWWEADLLLVSGVDNQQSLLGVFDSNSADNNHNVIADRFFHKMYPSSASQGNRNDVVGWDSAGARMEGLGSPVSPGIPFGVTVRVKGHYWHDGSVGRGTVNVYEIDADGGTGRRIMSVIDATVINTGASLAFNRFGLGNLTDGSLSTTNVIKADNLYFSTTGENGSPVSPSFAGPVLAGDFEPDGDVDWDDVAFFVNRWLNSCADPAWCGGADIDKDGSVDFSDYGEAAVNWLYTTPAITDYAIGKIADVNYLGAGREEKLDVYYPVNARVEQRFPAMVIIHGGGWKVNDKADGREVSFATTLVPKGYVCVSINYKLAKDAPSWPIVIQDCKNAVAFLRTCADKYQVDPNHIAAMGGSAGGHLAAMVGTVTDPNLEPSSPYPGVSTRVQAVIDMYGPTNLWTDYAPNEIPAIIGCDSYTCPDLWTLASPVSHVTSDDPPTLILHGMLDTTVDYHQSVELDEALDAAGVYSDLHLYPDLKHSFYLTGTGYDLRPLVIGFLDTYLK